MAKIDLYAKMPLAGRLWIANHPRPQHLRAVIAKLEAEEVTDLLPETIERVFRTTVMPRKNIALVNQLIENGLTL